MKIEGINVTAMELVLQTVVGAEGLELAKKLYEVTNEAMIQGFEAGFREADEASEAECGDYVDGLEEGHNAGFEEGHVAGYDAGYEEGYNDCMVEHGIGIGALVTNIKPMETPFSASAFRNKEKYAEELKANCAALDAEMKRVADAYDAEQAFFNSFYHRC